MNAPTFPADLTWVLRLHAPDAAPQTAAACCGQLEHVLSGRRHDFDDAAALLACLRHEQGEVQRAAPATAGRRP
jgi:hypothetical protein